MFPQIKEIEYINIEIREYTCILHILKFSWNWKNKKAKQLLRIKGGVLTVSYT